VREWKFAATDGYAAMPDPGIVAPVGVYYPDLLAPEGQNLYVFGFVDVTDIAGFAGAGIAEPPWDAGALVAPIDFKGLAQISAPLLYCDDGDDLRINLENLGLAVRPDLFDPHTIHWHGFANQIPYFDGVPDASLSVPSGSDLTYRYLPTDVGTYMYHCHVEDVEHVHMGLTGMVFIRTAESSPRWAAYNSTHSGSPLVPGAKYAYYDASTAYDREYAILLTEANVENHWNDGHIQESDWSEYRSTFGLMNGRSYPDTIEPNGPFFDRDAIGPGQPNGTWMPNQLTGDAAVRLAYQPNSALIQANAGDKVLLRISNLGFDEHSLVLHGDARADITKTTYRIDLGPGESRDILFTAPAHSGTGDYDTYAFYDRSILFRKKSAADSTTTDGYGAMRTEVRVYPLGDRPAQAHPNQLYV
jgi:FtsP/CotA-like multicopper oxidase with cupredoxin domain